MHWFCLCAVGGRWLSYA